MEYKCPKIIDRDAEYDESDYNRNKNIIIRNQILLSELPIDICESCQEISTKLYENYSKADRSFLDQLKALYEYPIEKEEIAEKIIDTEIIDILQDILEFCSDTQSIFKFNVYSDPELLIQSLRALIYFSQKSISIVSYCITTAHIIDSILDYFENYPPDAKNLALDFLSILFWDTCYTQLYLRFEEIISMVLPMITEIDGNSIYLLHYELLKNISASSYIFERFPKLVVRLLAAVSLPFTRDLPVYYPCCSSALFYIFQNNPKLLFIPLYSINHELISNENIENSENIDSIENSENIDSIENSENIERIDSSKNIDSIESNENIDSIESIENEYDEEESKRMNDLLLYKMKLDRMMRENKEYMEKVDQVQREKLIKKSQISQKIQENLRIFDSIPEIQATDNQMIYRDFLLIVFQKVIQAQIKPTIVINIARILIMNGSQEERIAFLNSLPLDLFESAGEVDESAQLAIALFLDSTIENGPEFVTCLYEKGFYILANHSSNLLASKVYCHFLLRTIEIMENNRSFLQFYQENHFLKRISDIMSAISDDNDDIFQLIKYNDLIQIWLNALRIFEKHMSNFKEFLNEDGWGDITLEMESSNPKIAKQLDAFIDTYFNDDVLLKSK